MWKILLEIKQIFQFIDSSIDQDPQMQLLQNKVVHNVIDKIKTYNHNIYKIKNQLEKNLF